MDADAQAAKQNAELCSTQRTRQTGRCETHRCPCPQAKMPGRKKKRRHEKAEP
jgi:hypothetical protein